MWNIDQRWRGRSYRYERTIYRTPVLHSKRVILNTASGRTRLWSKSTRRLVFSRATAALYCTHARTHNILLLLLLLYFTRKQWNDIFYDIVLTAQDLNETSTPRCRERGKRERERERNKFKSKQYTIRLCSVSCSVSNIIAPQFQAVSHCPSARTGFPPSAPNRLERRDDLLPYTGCTTGVRTHLRRPPSHYHRARNTRVCDSALGIVRRWSDTKSLRSLSFGKQIERRIVQWSIVFLSVNRRVY